ncbi:hypothetical protein [Sinorhizobium sp. RAC02]|uniref:hypothetical protein n=1 Tax=Sinorhizobium sp. RAC02 TaxID=1842534 RepID=UPI00083DD2EE|nr:hypothetical protein [Sinorhizobium sp. RAC02]
MEIILAAGRAHQAAICHPRSKVEEYGEVEQAADCSAARSEEHVIRNRPGTATPVTSSRARGRQDQEDGTRYLRVGRSVGPEAIRRTHSRPVPFDKPATGLVATVRRGRVIGNVVIDIRDSQVCGQVRRLERWMAAGGSRRGCADADDQ